MKELNKLREESIATDKGVRPIYAPSDSMYLFDIYCDNFFTEYTFSFESRWSPAYETIVSMCDYHNVNAELEYHEPGCLLFGRVNIDLTDEGSLFVYDYYLTNEEYLSAKETETYAYEYNGQYYECLEAALEAILEDKINKLNQ